MGPRPRSGKWKLLLESMDWPFDIVYSVLFADFEARTTAGILWAGNTLLTLSDGHMIDV